MEKDPPTLDPGLDGIELPVSKQAKARDFLDIVLAVGRRRLVRLGLLKEKPASEDVVY